MRFAPLGLGRPVWVDDPHFNLSYHVRHTALPAPGGEAQLRNLTGRVMAQQLDRAKPLWEMWIVEGLDDGRWALINKVHHCMVDGVSATDLLSVMLDPDPRPAAERAGRLDGGARAEQHRGARRRAWPTRCARARRWPASSRPRARRAGSPVELTVRAPAR